MSYGFSEPHLKVCVLKAWSKLLEPRIDGMVYKDLVEVQLGYHLIKYRQFGPSLPHHEVN